MTVTYTHEVADCRGFGNFWRLLFRWRGSVYKLVWMDLLAYTIVYYTLSAVYREVLDEEGKRLFEKVSLYCQYFSDLIPMSFILGFYVSIVIKRWWDQYMSLPWPDSLALFVSTSIHGHDRQGRLMRRTILRYANLSFVLTLTMVTPRAKKRFPTLDHILEAGLMTANEKKVFEGLASKTPHPVFYLPLVWAGTLVARARKEGRIRDDFAVKTIVDELNSLRGKCGGLMSYDWISIPLVYTQVVSLAVYTFFLSTIMGRQFLDPGQNYPKNKVDFYVPVFTMLQFFFYMGWLKVAESLVNPFGEDDDDFEVNWLIDRNIQVSYLIVDEMHNEHPELTQDLYWDEVFPQELPYTVAAGHFRRDPPMGSTVNVQVPESEQEFLLPMVDEEPEEGKISKRTQGPMGFKRLDSARSFGSSAFSGRKSSFLSILQQRLLRSGDHRSSMGSDSSIRRSQFRSVSRSESRVSADSTDLKRNTTNTSFQDSDVLSLSQESVSTQGGGAVHQGSSRKGEVGQHSPSPSPLLSKDQDTIIMKVAHPQGDSDESKGGDTARSKDPHTASTSGLSIFASQDIEGCWGMRGGEHKSDEGSHCSIRTSIFHDTEESPPASHCSTLPLPPHNTTKTASDSAVLADEGATGPVTSTNLEVPTIVCTPPHPDDKSVHRVSWDLETSPL